MIEKVLVAVDGSDHSDRAVRWAATLARRFGAPLTILHVTPHPTMYIPIGLPTLETSQQLYEAQKDALQAAATEILESAVAIAEGEGVTDVTSVAESGSPASAIVEHAKEQGIDVIVLGRRGLGDLGGLILGSVSHKVSHLADGAVVTVA